MPGEMFHIKSDSPVADDLMFWRIIGHESLSRPSFYELTVLSKDGSIQAKDILGRSFDVVIDFHDADNTEHERHCQGYAVRFARAGEVGRFFRYQIALKSWFGLLDRRSNSRILQDKTSKDIFNAVVDDSPISRIKKFEPKSYNSNKEHRYCVQFQETDYKFLSHLMEEEGVYYWFDAHDNAGMMYASTASDAAHKALPASDTLKYVPTGGGDARFNEITRWAQARRFASGKYASRDSDFKAIKKKPQADKGNPASHELADLEVFEFYGDFFRNDDTEAIAGMRMEELNSREQRYWALTGWPDVAVGRSFNFKGDPNQAADGEYLIGSCSFVVSHPGYESLQVSEDQIPLTSVLHTAMLDDAVNADFLDEWMALVDAAPHLKSGIPGSRAFFITVMPTDAPYRVPRLTPRVTMPGPQSGIVVGPEGEEIHADSFGRVKVHFHWDRYDESNEKSTAWIRVSQPWAGKGWGGYFIPRIGQEVIVDFLNGDPDRPIIVGRVYNDDQPIPFESDTQSGFRTRSTPNGTPKQFNELRFDDKAGAEQVHIRAQKRMDVCVEQNYYEHIKGSSSSTVGGSQLVTIGHKQHLVVKNKQYVKVDDDAHWLYMGDVKFGIAKSLSLAATDGMTLSGGAILIEAQQKLELQCGGSLIRLTPGGIEIEGPLVRINCGAGPAVGMSPAVIEAKEAGGSKCLEADPDKKKEKLKKTKPPVIVKPPPPRFPIPVPPPPQHFVILPFPAPLPPLPLPSVELCVSLHEVVNFGDVAIDEIDALIEELDDATTELLDQAEGMSKEATENFANRVTNAQAAMHDAKKEIAKAQKAACDQISSAGNQAQKLTKNVNNGVNRAMDRANAAVADSTVQDIMRAAGVGNDVNNVARDANAVMTDAQNTAQKAQNDAVSGATNLVNVAGKEVDGAAQDVLNVTDPALDQAKEFAADAHRAVSKASDDAKKALQAAKAAAQAARAAAKAAMAMADSDVCLPIPGLSALLAAARAEMQRLAAMAKALVQEGKKAAAKAMDDAKEVAKDVEKTVDDAAKAAEEEAKELLKAAEERLDNLKTRVEDAVDVAKQQAEQLIQEGQQTVEDTVATITNQVERAKNEAAKILNSI